MSEFNEKSTFRPEYFYFLHFQKTETQNTSELSPQPNVYFILSLRYIFVEAMRVREHTRDISFCKEGRAEIYRVPHYWFILIYF